MKTPLSFFLVLIFLNINAQIGGGWDWAFNTGSLGGANIKYMKYTDDGSEILFGGDAIAAVYFGSTTLVAPKLGSNPGQIKFLGKINSATGVPTIIKSFINLYTTLDCVTTDDVGNFYIAGNIYSETPVDFGNGVTASGYNHTYVAKFDSAGNAVWAKNFPLGATGALGTEVFRLAVSPAGNVFFWALNNNKTADYKVNYPLYKLDSEGNTVWFKDALNASTTNNIFKNIASDKFIDDEENVHLFLIYNGGFTFDGTLYSGTSQTSTFSTFISLDGNGIIKKAKTFDGGINDYQVNRTTGNIVFSWNQLNANPAPFDNLPSLKGFVNSTYINSFVGMIETDKNFNLIKAKDFSSTFDNPFSISNNSLKFLSLPNGKLLCQLSFVKNYEYNAGVDYVYFPDGINKATALVETDNTWKISKFITGGRAYSTIPDYITAYNDTYAMSSFFGAENTSALPTTSYGSVTLTGFNAALDLTTAYGVYSTAVALRRDVAIVQTKSSNFPQIGSTAWKGLSQDWNDPANWTNGTPSNLLKAIFDQPTPNDPLISSAPTAASLEIATGVSLPLPNDLILTGGIKNEGKIILKDAGFFQGLQSKEWKGNGVLEITGTATAYLYGNTFENSLILNTDFSTYNNLRIPKVTFNTGKFNMGNKTISITDRSDNAISGTSETSYFYGGKLERAINPTGNYEFPLGTATKNQTVSIASTGLIGVDKLSSTYTNGAITGTTPNINFNNTIINKALNGGWFSINPNQQPTSGTYDVTLKIQGSTNTNPSLGGYTVIKRTNATSNWEVPGEYYLATQTGSVISVTNKNLTSFSDFAIGVGTTDITLSTSTINKETLQVYPNPTRNKVTVSGSQYIKSITIFDTSGKQIQNKFSFYKSTDIDLSPYAVGIYFIRIQLEDGSVETKKVVKN